MGRGWGGGPDDKVHRRATWLSTNVFSDRPIDDEAVAAMQGLGLSLGLPRAMDLFREIEEKADQIKNPSGYLKSAARREGFGPPVDQGKASGKGKWPGTDPDKLRRRVNWLNNHTFNGNPIDEQAIASMQEIDIARALEILKEMEGKADSIKNPSSYLKTAAKRESFGTMAIAISVPSSVQAKGKGRSYEYEKVERRAGWLNKNVFGSSPIDEEAVAAMKGMGALRAMELFKEIEEKSEQIRNPSSYLKKAAMREGYGPPGKASGGKGRGAADLDRVHRRVNWMNNNVFAENPIDDDAIAVMQELEVTRAMELFKEIEGKADEVNNPSAYLITAAKRELGGHSRGVKRHASQARQQQASHTLPKKPKVEEEST